MKTVPVVIPEPQVRLLLWTAHSPLLDVSVKPVPDAVAVKPAHVPPMYHVPPLMMQPFDAPPVATWRVPFPENGVPGVVVGFVPGGVVVVEVVEPLGRYLMPVAGQLPFEPSVVKP